MRIYRILLKRIFYGLSYLLDDCCLLKPSVFITNLAIASTEITAGKGMFKKRVEIKNVIQPGVTKDILDNVVTIVTIEGANSVNTVHSTILIPRTQF